MAGTPDSTDWQRLGTLLERRRVELDPRYMNLTLFTRERGIDARLAADIEKARRTNFRSPTRRAIEVAYGWQPGSIDRVLEGGEPQATSASVHQITPRKPPDPGTNYVRPTYAIPHLEAEAQKLERDNPSLWHSDIHQLVQTQYLVESLREAQDRVRELEAENESLRQQVKRGHLKVTG